MIEQNLLTIVGNKIIEYPNEIGVRHLDKLKQACRDLNLFTEKNNEVEVATFLATNNYIVIMNSYSSLLLFIPENLLNYQIDFLMSKKEQLYKMQEDNIIIEIVITTEKEQDYNRKKYRNLGIEQQIAGYEGRTISSQLNILYEEIENQKMNTR